MMMIMETTIHAANRRGITNCGDTTPGRTQANVDLHPDTWVHVTCTDCLASR